MSNKHPRPCPGCLSTDLEITEKAYEQVAAIGTLYQCSVKCTVCGYHISRISDESWDHAYRAAVESWNKERI